MGRAIMPSSHMVGLNSAPYMDLRSSLAQFSKATPLFAAIFVVSLLYFPSLMTLWKKWILWDQDLAHALPTLAVMLALLGRKTYLSVETTQSRPIYWLLLMCLVGCSLCWYFFESLSISLPAYFMLMAALCLFIGATFSTSFMWALFPTLGLLIFTVPIWSELTGTLVKLSSLVVGYAVKLSDMTVLLDGNSLFLPSGTIYIADGCSGMRYLIISMLMGYILILINHYKIRTAIATMLIAAALGLFANWLRIYLLVQIGYHTEMQSSLMRDHETFGWILFACLLMPAIYLSPITKQPEAVIHIPKRPNYLPLFALAIGPLLLYFTAPSPSASAPLGLTHLDQYKTLPYSRIGADLDINISLTDKRTVKLEQLDIRVDLFTNTPQKAREEIVPFIGGLTNGSEWLLERTIKHSSDEANIGVYKKVGGNTRILIAKQFIIGKMKTDSYRLAKLLQVIAKISGDGYFGLLVVQTNCTSDCSAESDQIIRALPVISPPSS